MGKVFLVGAGPGDPDLITLKGLKAIAQADFILYDRLVNKELLNHASQSAQLIYCGKSPNHHSLEQEEINQLICDLASKGSIITRLKGGDPFIFGRGGEEAISLSDREIPFEIVPGITSGASAPAYAGIPVTQRNVSSSVAFVSGIVKDSVDVEAYWKHLARGPETLCIYMGAANLPDITALLTKYGRDPDTPAALIHSGTTAAQKTVTGTLRNIVERSKEMQNPVIIVIGEVVRLRDQIKWYEDTALQDNSHETTLYQ
ncbi:uroporphyrinogen-III C-methyltransferase [Salinicoccus albus]|uniref:uroporphyrinogen-III C-methyltransferase n=1 Tax=Salinicoccus albus TaxID=418756 RepID=UPI00035FD6F4|nr:uroporphyrinogen-III C-methyltransferase [Salinicoccus albus]